MDEINNLKRETTELRAALVDMGNRLVEHMREDDLVHQLEREINRSQNLDHIMSFALNWIMQGARGEHGLVGHWIPERELFEVLLCVGTPLHCAFKARETFTLPPELMPDTRVRTGEAQLYWNDNETCVVVDLRRPDGSLLGVLLIQRTVNHVAFTPTEQRFIRSASERLSISMHQAMLFNRVQALSQYRSQLFRMLSHDLRQPLTVLMGYIQLLELAMKMNNPSVMEEYVQNISKGAKDLAALLEEVLLKEQVDMASRENWALVSMDQLFQMVMDKYQPMAALKSHHLEAVQLAGDVYGKGMMLQLKEAAGNLVNNAIKYTPDHGHIRVTMWTENNRLFFEVADNGYGISPERQERLFEVFYRAQEPGTENIKGTGLGLNLVKSIIENHDGEVYFSSARGEGSTFGFWLPLADAIDLSGNT